jgi:hypothetical protein
MRADRTLVALLCLGTTLQADVLVRWDQDQVPSPASLGISTLVVPAKNSAAIQNAGTQGYGVYLEVEASALAGFTPPAGPLAGVVVKGAATREQLLQLRQRLESPRARVLALEERAKWPHIRSNWVTRRDGVLHVAGRSAQPWIETNAALLRIARATRRDAMPLLTYPWKPLTLSEIDEGPGIENYLVAIAETGSFGGDLLLPLHERFEKDLLLGKPQARAGWSDIRRYIDFYSWNLPGRYRPLANIGVVTREPMRSFEVMNLLARHNLPFEVVDPTRLEARALASFRLLVVLEPTDTRGPWRSSAPVLQTEERAMYRFGSVNVVEVLKGVRDPNAFALEMRKLLGRDDRTIDIWNGMTVVAAPYEAPDGKTVLVTALNYSHQPLPVQLRVPGTFSAVHYESPEEAPALLPHEHRDGGTEFVLPALRIGGRVFLSRDAPPK